MAKQVSMTLDKDDIAEAVRLWMNKHAPWAPNGTLDVRMDVQEQRDCRDEPMGHSVSIHVTITPQ